MGFVADQIREWRETRGLVSGYRKTPLPDYASPHVDGWWDYIAPWHGPEKRYPGRWRLISLVAGVGVAGISRWPSSPGRMPSDAAIRIATYIESRCDAGLKIARELREYAEKVPEKQPARGFRVVRERDGAGSEPRDGRRRK